MDKTQLYNLIKFWEKRRIWFNLLVILTAIVSLLKLTEEPFAYLNLVEICIYGFAINLFYSLGILVEIFNFYYLKNKLQIKKIRTFLYAIGTFLSCLFIYFQITFYFLWNVY